MIRGSCFSSVGFISILGSSLVSITCCFVSSFTSSIFSISLFCISFFSFNGFSGLKIFLIC